MDENKRNERVARFGLLAQLAKDLTEKQAETNKRIDELSDGVSETILNEMYQRPVTTQYRTTGNMDTSGMEGDITGETLQTLMGDYLGEDLDFVINGVTVGTYTGDTTLAAILSDINSSDASVGVSWSQETQEFTFTAKKTGVGGKIELGEGLAEAMFGPAGVVSPKFADAYGVLSWADKVTFEFAGDRITLNNFDKDSTIEEIADRLNAAIGSSAKVAS